MPKVENRMTFVLCDGDSVNSYGFRTDVGGISLERFKANPVMLFGHDSWNLESVIGRWENVRVEGSKLMADAVFDTETERGKDVAGRVERGFLRGCSMGLRVKRFVEYEDGSVAEASELMEASICAIPSDGNAIRLYDDNNKVITYEEMMLAFNNPLNNKESMKENEKTEKTDSSVENLQAQLGARDSKIRELEETIAKMQKSNVDSFLSAAVSAGKITEAEKEGFAKLSASDFESVQTIINAKTPKASASLKEMTAKSNASSGREDWTYLRWMKEDPKGLKKMKAENPEEFARLQETLK